MALKVPVPDDPSQNCPWPPASTVQTKRHVCFEISPVFNDSEIYVRAIDVIQNGRWNLLAFQVISYARVCSWHIFLEQGKIWYIANRIIHRYQIMYVPSTDELMRRSKATPTNCWGLISCPDWRDRGFGQRLHLGTGNFMVHCEIGCDWLFRQQASMSVSLSLLSS